MFIAPDHLSVGLAPNGSVSLRLGKPHSSLGFADDLVFAVELTPSESRELGQLLVRKADEAEARHAPKN